MDVIVDTKSDLVSSVVDVRYTPLSQLAREAASSVSESLAHVLPDAARESLPVSAFQSSI
jgi:FXSXX-COOH protein